MLVAAKVKDSVRDAAVLVEGAVSPRQEDTVPVGADREDDMVREAAVSGGRGAICGQMRGGLGA